MSVSLIDHCASAAPVESDAAAAIRALRTALALTVLGAIFALVGWQLIINLGLTRPSSGNIFFRLYAPIESFHLTLLLTFTVSLSALVHQRGDGLSQPKSAWLDRLAPPEPRAVAALALLVVLLSIFITNVVFHRLLFSMDEFSADFQARVFARGQYAAEIRRPWRSIGDAITPIFVGFDAVTGRWYSQYLPGYALVKAPFVRLGAGTFLNPLIAGASVVVLAAIARRLWPAEGVRPWVALLLLATSSEFLVTSGTGYSMPAHLLLNLVWLLLYMRGDRVSWAAALVVGSFALGLHSPFPHALFVAPFFLRLVRERAWGRLSSAVAVYLASSVAWFAWLQFVHPLARDGGGGLVGLFELPALVSVFLQGMNISLLFTWQAPIFGILILAVLLRPRGLDPLLSDLALGALFTLTFFLFFPVTQGHGWGYRYAFQVIGNLALLAAAGVPTLQSAMGNRRTECVLAGAFLLALVVELPKRLVAIESFVRPFSASTKYIGSRPAEIVILDADSVWYGRDLVRNDPFLARPIVVSLEKLAPGSAERIERTYPGRVIRVTDAQLLQLGMTPWDRHERYRSR